MGNYIGIHACFDKSFHDCLQMGHVEKIYEQLNMSTWTNFIVHVGHLLTYDCNQLREIILSETKTYQPMSSQGKHGTLRRNVILRDQVGQSTNVALPELLLTELKQCSAHI